MSPYKYRTQKLIRDVVQEEKLIWLARSSHVQTKTIIKEK
jgi:hypothetical protein